MELLDCRDVKTAEDMFEKILTHLDYAANDGAIKPVISVFAPKTNGKSAPVRIWYVNKMCPVYIPLRMRYAHTQPTLSYTFYLI